MASLQEAVSERRHYLDTQPKRLPVAEIREAYVRANRRLLILDYDGTLIPLSKQAKQAAPPPVVIDLLTALAAEPRNCVALMLGRPAEHVDRWFGSIGGIWLVAEDGAELRPPLSSSWEPLRSPVPTDWKSTVMPILEHFVDRTPGSFVEERKYALLWHNRTAEPEFGAWLANELVSMPSAKSRDYRGGRRQALSHAEFSPQCWLR